MECHLLSWLRLYSYELSTPRPRQVHPSCCMTCSESLLRDVFFSLNFTHSLAVPALSSLWCRCKFTRSRWLSLRRSLHPLEASSLLASSEEWISRTLEIRSQDMAVSPIAWTVNSSWASLLIYTMPTVRERWEMVWWGVFFFWLFDQSDIRTTNPQAIMELIFTLPVEAQKSIYQLLGNHLAGKV